MTKKDRLLNMTVPAGLRQHTFRRPTPSLGTKPYLSATFSDATCGVPHCARHAGAFATRAVAACGDTRADGKGSARRESRDQALASSSSSASSSWPTRWVMPARLPTLEYTTGRLDSAPSRVVRPLKAICTLAGVAAPPDTCPVRMNTRAMTTAGHARRGGGGGGRGRRNVLSGERIRGDIKAVREGGGGRACGQGKGMATQDPAGTEPDTDNATTLAGNVQLEKALAVWP